MTALDTLLATVRTKAVLGGPLQSSATLYADGGGTGVAVACLLSPANEQTQMLQAQGVIEGRRATILASAADVTAAISRDLHRGDEFRIASGHYAGTWVVETANLVRGGWARAELRLERMADAGPMQEMR